MKKDKDKRIQKPGKKETSIVRSSAAEYLTFVAASGKGGVEAVYADENIWLTQKMMGVLYDVETHTINYHLKKVFADSELEEDSGPVFLLMQSGSFLCILIEFLSDI
jgi:hypothetical protein